MNGYVLRKKTLIMSKKGNNPTEIAINKTAIKDSMNGKIRSFRNGKIPSILLK
jgi:hypothetical protein